MANEAKALGLVALAMGALLAAGCVGAPAAESVAPVEAAPAPPPSPSTEAPSTEVVEVPPTQPENNSDPAPPPREPERFTDTYECVGIYAYDPVPDVPCPRDEHEFEIPYRYAALAIVVSTTDVSAVQPHNRFHVCVLPPDGEGRCSFFAEGVHGEGAAFDMWIDEPAMLNQMGTWSLVAYGSTGTEIFPIGWLPVVVLFHYEAMVHFITEDAKPGAGAASREPATFSGEFMCVWELHEPNPIDFLCPDRTHIFEVEEPYAALRMSFVTAEAAVVRGSVSVCLLAPGNGTDGGKRTGCEYLGDGVYPAGTTLAHVVSDATDLQRVGEWRLVIGGGPRHLDLGLVHDPAVARVAYTLEVQFHAT